MPKQHDDQTPTLEWIVGGIGALLFMTIIAVLLNNAFSGDTPPKLRTEVERIDPTGETFTVAFTAFNDGDTTAANVQFTATLQIGAREETRQVTFDYLPPHSSFNGGFVFADDPRQGTLRIEAEGYLDP